MKQVDDTFAIAEILVNDDEELVQKATGWMLRSAGDKDRKRLLEFLDKHAAILGGSHHKEGSHLSAPLHKGKHIGVTVSHVNPHLSARRWTHLLDGSRPGLAFTRALSPLSTAPFASVALARGRHTHPGLLMHEPQDALAVLGGPHRQHTMNEKAAMAAIADGA